MESKHKLIIIALIAVIAVLLMAIFVAMPTLNKQGTDLTFKSKSKLTEGDSLKIKLTDVNGSALANQTVNITITGKDKSSDYHSVVTDSKGIGKLKLDKDAGKYTVTISYGGNDNYAASNATKKIIIEEEVVEAVVEQSSSSQSGGGSSTHTIMGEDGYYYTVDDSGNILESLGPSQKHYPNNPNSVDYPDAEPSSKYIDKSQ